MDTAYLHLITNHIPIIGVPLALFLLAFGLWRRSDELKTAAFLIFAFLGAATVAVYLLGQGGEDFVEELAGVSGDAIEAHEEFAKFALGSVAATAIVSLFALVRYRGFSFIKRRTNEKDQTSNGETAAAMSQFPNWITFTVLLLALLSAAILGYTGKLGGQIRHTEFYGGAAEIEESDGRNRRGQSERRPEKIPPVAENQSETETGQTADGETDEESGKGRGRGRGGR